MRRVGFSGSSAAQDVFAVLAVPGLDDRAGHGKFRVNLNGAGDRNGIGYQTDDGPVVGEVGKCGHVRPEGGRWKDL